MSGAIWPTRLDGGLSDTDDLTLLVRTACGHVDPVSSYSLDHPEGRNPGEVYPVHVRPPCGNNR